METKFIDLALPSGTLWAAENNEKKKTYLDARGKDIPTKEDFKELITNCSLKNTPKGVKFTGKNGKSIVLQREGYATPIYTVSRKEATEKEEVQESKERQYQQVDDGNGYYRTECNGRPGNTVLFVYEDGRIELRASENSYQFSIRQIKRKSN